MLKGLFLASGGFLIFLVAHAGLFRWSMPERRFVAMVRLAAAIGAGMIAFHRMTPSDLGFLPASFTGAGWGVDLLNGTLAYGFLFIGYCMFYFLVDRGFSGRIMIEIEEMPERRLRRQDIAARYSMETVLRRRLGEMLEIGRIVVKEGRFCNTAKGQSAAAMFVFVKRFLQLGEGG